MNKRPDKQPPKTDLRREPKKRAGAKEVLTYELARKIARMVEQFPDANIAVTWDNVVRQTKLRFGRDLRRNVLSRKAWDGRKIIADAFADAKGVQRRQARDKTPKYVNEPRARLRLIVEKLQSEVLALREQLAQVRAVQYDAIHSLLDTRTPLHRLGEMRSTFPRDERESNKNHQIVTSIQQAKASPSKRRPSGEVKDLLAKKEIDGE